MNNLDKQYTDLLQDILDNGVTKKDRTGTGTISVFGRQIRHKMSDGFPLLTTKKMAWKTMVTELLWFLRGDTNIKYLVDNGCHIWDGDAYKNYLKNVDLQDIESRKYEDGELTAYTQEEFINKIKTDDEFAKKWGELGPIYGKQWRSWRNFIIKPGIVNLPNGKNNVNYWDVHEPIDQIQNLINELKTNPDSRRLMVSAWNVGELDQMVLPPCHYGFQVYTRELSLDERQKIFDDRGYVCDVYPFNGNWGGEYDGFGIPRRAISLMWNQRSCDFFLGIPFNIASYGLLLMMIADEVNMVPDELIGNLGDTHIYLNHVEQAKEQIGRDYTLEERLNMVSEEIQKEFSSGIVNLPNFPNTPVWSDDGKMSCLDDFGVPRRTREPYPLPTVHVRDGIFCSSINDVILENYQSHPSIKAPLSN
jgi:thymidylate synthase